MNAARPANVVPLPRAAPKVEPFRLRFPRDIDGPPPPPHWTVDGMLLAGTVCLLAGAPNLGKSLASMQMLTAIALGREWMGRATEQARCLAIFAEDRPDQLDKRALAICEHYDVHNSMLEQEFAWDAREDRETTLWDVKFGRGEPTEFWHQMFDPMTGLVAEDGYRVVLLDTAAAVYRGNHNDTGQVNAFVRALTRSAVHLGICILLTAHPSRASPTSSGGSGQWEAACRFAFNLARPAPPQGVDPEEMRFGDSGRLRVFRGLGANYVETARPERWRWQDGVFVLDETEDDADRRRQAARPLTAIERADLEYRMLIGVKRVLQNGGHIVADEMSPQSAPNRARRCADTMINRVPLNDLYIAQQGLLDAGRLVRVRVGQRCLLRPVDGPNYPDEAPWEVA